MKMQWSQDDKGHWNGTHESGYNVHIHVRATDDKYTTHKFNATAHAPAGAAANGQGSSHAHGTDDLDEAKKIGERKASEMQRRRQSATVRQAAGELTPLDHTKGTAMAKTPDMSTREGRAAAHYSALQTHQDHGGTMASFVSPVPTKGAHTQVKAVSEHIVDGHRQAAQFHTAEANSHRLGSSGRVAGGGQVTEEGKAHLRAAEAHEKAAAIYTHGTKTEYGAAARHASDATAATKVGNITAIKETSGPKTADEHIAIREQHKAAAKAAMNPSEKGAHQAAATAHEMAASYAAGNFPKENYPMAAAMAADASKHAEWETQTRKSVTTAFVAGAQGKANPSTGAGAKDAHQLGGLVNKSGPSMEEARGALKPGARDHMGMKLSASVKEYYRNVLAGTPHKPLVGAEGKPHENLARQLQQGARGGSFHISKGGHKIYHPK